MAANDTKARGPVGRKLLQLLRHERGRKVVSLAMARAAAHHLHRRWFRDPLAGVSLIRSWGTTVDTLVTTFIAKPMAATAKHHVSINFLVAAPWSGEGACHAVLTMAVSICANVRISLADR